MRVLSGYQTANLNHFNFKCSILLMVRKADSQSVNSSSILLSSTISIFNSVGSECLPYKQKVVGSTPTRCTNAPLTQLVVVSVLHTECRKFESYREHKKVRRYLRTLIIGIYPDKHYISVNIPIIVCR